ncbi:MAG: class I SAM-dependent methyltransferase [Desulfovibrio sp.]|nr:class I SAM-dependent methyltransferase [Desulfovibrio sp.]
MSRMNIENFKCCLCGSDSYTVRPGHARDNAALVPLECTSCGLVRLSSFSHIDAHFYEDSHMRDGTPCDPKIMQTVGDENNVRRFHDFYPLFAGKSLLDFGCGDGGFLALAKTKADIVLGLEPDKGWIDVHKNMGIPVVRHLADIPDDSRFDVVTMFHVLEHLSNPLEIIRNILKYLKINTVGGGGILLVEVPSASDALLTLYENAPFSQFTYWSPHLFLYTPGTLQMLMSKAGCNTVDMRQFQRYPLANHLYWLARGKPGGQLAWSQLSNPVLSQCYADALAAMGKCDTIIGIFAPE